MKPAAGLDISQGSVAALHGEDVQPLSKLAARTDEERAEHFTFTEEDQKLLDEVLAGKDKHKP
jgi:hypothetical protein